MNIPRIVTCLLVAVAMTACPDDDPTPSTADATGDVAADATTDVGADVPEPEPGYENAPPATPELWAGATFTSFRFPIGVPTVGFGPGTGGVPVVTRFNEIYSGTDAQHTDVGAKTVVMRANGKTFVQVRLDLIGLWDTNRDEVAAELRALGRGDLADGLILSATHTHASGGRLMDHPIIRIAVDTYVPGMFGRVLKAIVASIIEADANAVPAEFGWTSIQVPQLHSDRRCENGDVQDDTMGLMKLTRVEDGEIIAVIVNYAMHGTVLGGDQHTLSSDAPGAVEFGVERKLPKDAKVLFVQSWGGDMAPEAPDDSASQQGFDLRPDFVKLDKIAAAAADIIVPALDGIAMNATPDIHVENIRFPMDPLEINNDGSFDEYPYGGIYCMDSSDNCPGDPDGANGGQPYTSASCYGFSEEETITSSQIAAARIDDLGMVTLPGEPVTPLGLELRDRAIAATGLTQVLVLGYSQGYLGYLLHPDDYWMGGYEGSGSLMGPRGGQFLVDMGVSIAERAVNPDSTLAFEPVDFRWGTLVPYAPLNIEEALGAAAVSVEPAVADGVIEASWVGGDPAADHPVVTLQKDTGGGTFEDVTRSNGSVVTNYGPEMEIYLAVEPRYPQQKFGARTFTWTVKLPTVFSVPLDWGPLQGTYRFVIEGTRPDAYSLTTAAFDI